MGEAFLQDISPVLTAMPGLCGEPLYFDCKTTEIYSSKDNHAWSHYTMTCIPWVSLVWHDEMLRLPCDEIWHSKADNSSPGTQHSSECQAPYKHISIVYL